TVNILLAAVARLAVARPVVAWEPQDGLDLRAAHAFTDAVKVLPRDPLGTWPHNDRAGRDHHGQPRQHHEQRPPPHTYSGNKRCHWPPLGLGSRARPPPASHGACVQAYPSTPAWSTWGRPAANVGLDLDKETRIARF